MPTHIEGLDENERCQYPECKAEAASEHEAPIVYGKGTSYRYCQPHAREAITHADNRIIEESRAGRTIPTVDGVYSRVRQLG